MQLPAGLFLALDSSAWAMMAVEGALKQVSRHGREVVDESWEGNEVGYVEMCRLWKQPWHGPVGVPPC